MWFLSLSHFSGWTPLGRHWLAKRSVAELFPLTRTGGQHQLVPQACCFWILFGVCILDDFGFGWFQQKILISACCDRISVQSPAAQLVAMLHCGPLPQSNGHFASPEDEDSSIQNHPPGLTMHRTGPCRQACALPELKVDPTATGAEPAAARSAAWVQTSDLFRVCVLSID